MSKAQRLATTHASWIRCRDKQGKPLAFGIQSATQPGLFHMVGTTFCDCLGFQNTGDCYHSAAIRIRVRECKAAKQQATLATRYSQIYCED